MNNWTLTKSKLVKFKVNPLFFFIWDLLKCSLTFYEYLPASVTGAQIRNNPWVWHSHNILPIKNDKSKHNSM